MKKSLKVALIIWLSALATLVSAQLSLPDPPAVTLKSETTSAKPGETVEAVMTVTFGEGLHAYQNPQEDETIIPISVQGGEGVKIIKVDYPKGESKIIEAISPNPYFLHSGTITIPFTFEAPASAPAEGVPIEFHFQQCDDTTCYMPDQVTVNLPLTIEGGTITGSTTGNEPEAAPSASAPSAAPSAGNEDGLVKYIRQIFAEGQWLLIIPTMIFVGLLINLTPCVYPLVPITLSYFANQSKDNGGKRVTLGLMYMFGMAITFGAVGGIAASAGGFFGELFTMPWFNIFLGLLMVGLALSMFDLYQIGLPPFITKQLKGRSGPIGSLIMGLFVGFAAAPCAGPFIAAIFIEVAKLNNIGIGVGVFMAIGLGIGLPYVALSALAVGAKDLPKGGTWMKAVKAAMGILVIYFGVDYLIKGLPTLVNDANKPWIWVGFFGLAGLLMLIYESKNSDHRAWFIKGGTAMLCGIALGQALTSSAPKAAETGWIKFDEAAFETAKASGKPIFIDGTADWCAECKVIEAKIFNTPEGQEILKSAVTLKIDLSSGVDPAYKKMVTEKFGIAGLPHLEFYSPGGTNRQVRRSLHSIEEFRELMKASGAKL